VVIRSDDGKLEVKLSRPGTSGAGANPEQLFAGRLVGLLPVGDGTRARRMKRCAAADHAVDAEVDLRTERRWL